MIYQLLVNGRRRSIDAWDPAEPLLYVLRDELGLTGAKIGCGLGQCGSCTVLVDDQPARACMVPIASLAGRRVTTIEGLGTPGQTRPAAGRIHRRTGGAVRLLHERHDHERQGAAARDAAAH